MDHFFQAYKDEKAAFAGRGGVFDEGAARAMVEWLRAH